jgi:hypothetical protein
MKTEQEIAQSVAIQKEIKRLFKLVQQKQGEMIEGIISNPSKTNWRDKRVWGKGEDPGLISIETESVVGTVMGMSAYVSLMAAQTYVMVKLDGWKHERRHTSRKDGYIHVDAEDVPGAQISGFIDQANGIKGMRVELTYRITKINHPKFPQEYQDLIMVRIVSPPEELRAISAATLKGQEGVIKRELKRCMQSGPNHTVSWIYGPLTLLNNKDLRSPK